MSFEKDEASQHPFNKQFIVATSKLTNVWMGCLLSFCKLLITLGSLMIELFICSMKSFWLFWDLMSSDKSQLSDEADLPKSVVITGAGSGIGAALARQYAKEGAFLVLVDKCIDNLKQVSLDCQNKGSVVEAWEADVTSPEFRQSLTKLAERQQIDIVIANAGISFYTLPEEMDFHDKMHSIFNVNVMGVVNTISSFLPVFKDRKAGQIVLMGSLAGNFSPPNQVSYNASKSAVIRLGRDLRAIMRQYGVRVNTVTPGFVKSTMTDSLLRQGYKLPFLRDTEMSAEQIKKELDLDIGLIAFPLPLWLCSVMMSNVSPLLMETLLELVLPFLSIPYEKCG